MSFYDYDGWLSDIMAWHQGRIYTYLYLSKLDIDIFVRNIRTIRT